MERFCRALVCLVCIVFLSACGGGGGSGGEDVLPGVDAALQNDDAAAVAAARAALVFETFKGANEAPDRITTDLAPLPSTGREGTTLSWRSGSPGVLSSEGRVTRPAGGDLQVVLTATLSRGGASDEKTFVLLVLQAPAGDEVAVAEDAEALTFDRIRGANAGPGVITSGLQLPIVGSNGSTISWHSSDTTLISASGTVDRPPFTDSDRPVTLTAALSRGTAHRTCTFDLTVLKEPVDEAEAVALDAALLTFGTIRGGNSAPEAIEVDLELPTAGWNGTAISWTSSSAAVGENGRVVRPSAGTPNLSVTLRARVGLGSAAAEKTFQLIVLALPEAVDFAYGGTGVAVDHPPVTTQVAADTFTYRLDLGAARRDVYFVFTNTALTRSDGYPVVTPLSALNPEEELRQAAEEGRDLSRWARDRGEGLSGAPEITLFNSDPWGMGGIDRELRAAGAPPRPALMAVDAVGDTRRFYDAWNQPVNATCRKVTSADGRTLNVWVADNAWAAGSCSRSRCVTQEMVNALADRFLRPGPGNDIYNDVTNIFGAEWGSHSQANMIPPDGNLTLLLLDIENDNSVHGGILGYFFSRDNFRASAFSTSNERLLIAIDSVMLANPTGSTWEITDKWPQDFLATLGHELQHMIHFYQKGVLRQGISQTWLNEMCCLVTEDLIAENLGIDGPRGIAPGDGSGGRSGTTTGRLPRFDYYNYLSLTDWLEGSVSESGEGNRLNSYAVSYAFGAYLARNYGGPSFFRDVVQNGYGDHRAIESALSAWGYADDFPSVLQKWGVATLLSDRSGGEVPEGYRYNRGGYLESPLDGDLYRLGSINLFNYVFNASGGPRIFTQLPQAGEAGRHPSSNLIYRLGTGLTGTLSQDITLPKGMRLSVVIK